MKGMNRTFILELTGVLQSHIFQSVNSPYCVKVCSLSFNATERLFQGSVLLHSFGFCFFLVAF